MRRLPTNFEDAVEADQNQPTGDRLRRLLREGYRVDGKNPFPVLLYGPTGTGKSYCAALAYAQHETQALWYKASRFVRDINTCRSSRSKTVACPYQGGDPQFFGNRYDRTEAKLFEMASNSNILWVIDELALENKTPSARDIMYDLLDCRQKRPTVVTCNLDLAAIADDYDDRVASRLACGMQLLVDGEDRRAQNGVSR